MKCTVLLAMAFTLMVPLIARSQQGSNKLGEPDPSSSSRPMHQKITREEAVVLNQGSAGGGASESGYIAEEGMYLNPSWAPGYVTLNDRTVIDNLLLRYDIYHQQFQFIREGDTMAFASPNELQELNMDGKRFVYAGYECNGAVSQGYLELLSDGACKLLLRRKVQYHMEPGSKPRLDDELYVRECEYYIMREDQPAKPIRACKKSVLCAFKDKEPEIKEFLDNNNLKLKNCDELKQVVAYYNSIR